MYYNQAFVTYTLWITKQVTSKCNNNMWPIQLLLSMIPRICFFLTKNLQTRVCALIFHFILSSYFIYENKKV